MLLKRNDDKIKTAAVALCVGVGNFSDPPDLQGLAHFLEHLLFMGSEKYPKENHYSSFLYENGGTFNAVTGHERTTYYMQIGPRNFRKALDIFANCFKSPLLRANNIDREVEAIDSEFHGIAGKDDLRISLILHDAVKTGHPMSKFACGNKKSLKVEPAEKNIDVHAELRKFYDQYYSANNMTLAVQSTKALEISEQWVVESFSDIPNNEITVPYFGDQVYPFKTDIFHKLYRVKAVIDSGELIMLWYLPPLSKYYRSKPMKYLGSQIGHEGKGSILSYLKKRCWATYLEAGCDVALDLNSTGTLFHVSIALTLKGGDYIYEILTIVLKFINMLRKTGPQEAYFNELKTAADIKFQHEDQIISECLELLTPELLNIRILSCNYSNNELNKTEKWTNCKYVIEDIPADWLESWKDLDECDELFFPVRNKFISTNFELKPHEDREHKYPWKIIDDEYGCVWFKEDRKYKIPKTFIKICLNSPIATESPESANKVILFQKMIQYVLSEDIYSATEAGLKYFIDYLTYGIMISLEGFNDKIAVLLEEIIDHIAKFEVSDELFEVSKVNLFQDYDNFLINPSSLAWSLSAAITLTQNWTYNAKKIALNSITKSDLNEFVQKYFSNFYINSYYHGNVTKEEVIAMNKMVRSKLKGGPVSDTSFMEVKTVKMPNAISICRVESYNKADEISIVRNCYQLGPYNLTESCKSSLFVDLMQERFFDTLRTHEQLGYSIYSYLTFLSGIFTIEIHIESPSHKYSVPYIDERIEEFIKTFIAEMSELTNETFKNKKSHRRRGDLNMGSEVGRFWDEIANRRFIFNRIELEKEYYESLELEDFKIWVKETIGSALNRNKKLSIQVIGPSDEIIKKETKTDFGNKSNDNIGEEKTKSKDIQNTGENEKIQGNNDGEQVKEKNYNQILETEEKMKNRHKKSKELDNVHEKQIVIKKNDADEQIKNVNEEQKGVEKNGYEVQKAVRKSVHNVQKELNCKEQAKDCTINSAEYIETNVCYKNNSTSDPWTSVTGNRDTKLPVDDKNEANNNNERNMDCIVDLIQYQDMDLKFLIDQNNSSDDIYFISNIEEFKSNLPVYESNIISP